LQSLEGHDGGEHNAHQNIITITIKAMTILIIPLSGRKIKLIMSENNANNINETQLNKISIVIHNVMIKIYYYNMST
jgi:hypothetical protein